MVQYIVGPLEMVGLLNVAIVQLTIAFFPWPLRRWMLERIYGFKLDRDARIGFSLIRCRRLTMKSGSRIGHCNFINGLDFLELGVQARIGNLNWITGFPAGNVEFFALDRDRMPILTIGEHAAVTHRHFIDCTDHVEIGAFSIVAGWRSQIYTHAIDINENRQMANRVVIGTHCFVGTGVIILKGAVLPNCCVLGAGSVLTTALHDEFTLYVGNPAVAVRELDPNAKYFHRKIGFVH